MKQSAETYVVDARPRVSGYSDRDGFDNPNGLGVFRLVTTIVMLVIGGGAFTLSGDMAQGGSGSAAVMCAWGIAGVGTLCLLMSFYGLTRIRPQLTGGIYSYAATGFGRFCGFSSAWGYSLSALFGNMGYCVLLFGALGYFFPVLGDGTNLPSVVGMSIALWLCTYLVTRGVHEVSSINIVVSIAKCIPLLVAVVAIIFIQTFDPAVFMANFEGDTAVPLFDQVMSCMSVTVWVFIGVEGAVAISGRAKRARDVGKATLVAFFCVLALYLMVSLLSMGVMPREELAALGNPSFAGVLEVAVGPWGAGLINLGVCISLLGSLLGFTLLASEAPFEAAEQGVFPPVFAKTNSKGAPVVALLCGTVLVQVFLLTVIFSDSTYQVFYTMSASMILLPYLLSAAFFVKVLWKDKGTEAVLPARPRWMLMGTVACIYAVFMYYATGIDVVVASALLYAPGIVVHMVGASQRGLPAFESRGDRLLLVILLILLAVSIFLLITGQAGIV